MQGTKRTQLRAIPMHLGKRLVPLGKFVWASTRRQAVCLLLQLQVFYLANPRNANAWSKVLCTLHNIQKASVGHQSANAYRLKRSYSTLHPLIGLCSLQREYVSNAGTCRRPSRLLFKVRCACLGGLVAYQGLSRAYITSTVVFALPSYTLPN